MGLGKTNHFFPNDNGGGKTHKGEFVVWGNGKIANVDQKVHSNIDPGKIYLAEIFSDEQGIDHDVGQTGKFRAYLEQIQFFWYEQNKKVDIAFLVVKSGNRFGILAMTLKRGG